MMMMVMILYTRGRQEFVETDLKVNTLGFAGQEGVVKSKMYTRSEHNIHTDFIYYRSVYIVENKFNQILGETIGKHDIFFETKLHLMGLRIIDPQRSSLKSHQIRLF